MKEVRINRNLGIALSNLKRFEAALDDFEKAIEHAPDYLDAYSEKGK